MQFPQSGSAPASELPAASATDSYRSFERKRASMVESQIAARGIRSLEVLKAMSAVRREHYLPSHLGELAYEDTSLPTGEGRVIAQPFAVAFLVDALQLMGSHRVLEIGTGAGYTSAVLAQIAAEIYTVEAHEELTVIAATRFARDGYSNVRVRHGDGSRGWPEDAPFDAILLNEGGARATETLRGQLLVGGRMVMPAGVAQGMPRLIRVTRVSAEDYRTEELPAIDSGAQSVSILA